MTTAIRWMAVAMMCALARCGAAAPAPEKSLASDTLAFFAVSNWVAAAATLQRTSWGQFLTDPSMRPFRDSWADHFKKEIVAPLDKELGFELATVVNLFQGPVTLAFTPAVPDGQPGRSSSFVLLADTGANSSLLASNLAFLQRRWAAAGRQTKPIRLRDQEFTALTLSVAEIGRLLNKLFPEAEKAQTPSPTAPEQPVMGEWTIGQAGSFLLVSDSARELDKVLALLRTNPPPTLAETKLFAPDAAQLHEALACGWINVRAALDHLGRAAPPPKPESSGEPAGALSLSQMLRALGFGGLQTIVFTAQESQAGTFMTLRFRAPEADRKGLFKMARLEAQDSGPPAFVPADVIKFRRARLDLPVAWAQLEATLAEASPAAASLLKFIVQTAGKDKDQQFDLRERLLARLGDDLLSYDKAPRLDAASQAEADRSLMLVGARNPEQVVSAMKALPSLLPPETTRRKEREFLGRTICSATLPRNEADGSVTVGPAWYYAAGPSHVALSSDVGMVEEYLRGNDTVNRALRDAPGLAEAARQAGGLNTGFFSYENNSEAARAFFAAARKDMFNAASLLSAVKLGSRLGLGQEIGFLSWCDFFLLPPYERVAKYFYLDVSTLSADKDGFSYRFFAPTPPALRK